MRKPIALMTLVLAAMAVTVTSATDRKPVGAIDCFGYKGLDVEAVRAGLPFHEGDLFPPAGVKHSDDPLLEMARWRSIGHAEAALVILGRMAGIDEETLNKLIDAGQVDTILGSFDRQ